MKLLTIFSLIIFTAHASFYFKEDVPADQLYDFLVATDNQRAIKQLVSLPVDCLSRKNAEFIVEYCTHFYLLQEALPTLKQHDATLHWLAKDVLDQLEPYVEKINFSHMIQKMYIIENYYQRSNQKNLLHAD